uniref:RIKEN cDNA A630076J17 gene n=1 Tax=Mus spicilegus TaxID=10103 RepID=A0A8C6IM27_MUSSI
MTTAALSDTPCLDIILSSSGMERSFSYQEAGFLTSTVQDLQWSPNQEELPRLFLKSCSPLFAFTFLATSTLSTRWRQIPIVEDGRVGPKNSHLSCGWILKECQLCLS